MSYDYVNLPGVFMAVCPEVVVDCIGITFSDSKQTWKEMPYVL